MKSSYKNTAQEVDITIGKSHTLDIRSIEQNVIKLKKMSKHDIDLSTNIQFFKRELITF